MEGNNIDVESMPASPRLCPTTYATKMRLFSQKRLRSTASPSTLLNEAGPYAGGADLQAGTLGLMGNILKVAGLYNDVHRAYFFVKLVS